MAETTLYHIMYVSSASHLFSMGFRDLSDPEVQATPGFSQYMNTPLVAESFVDDPSGCLGLMEVFKPAF